MAKSSVLARTAKRAKLVDKYRAQRAELKKVIKSSTDYDAIMAAQEKLAKLPLNSNPVRLNTRCQQCGRSHGVYAYFGLCRICLRKHLMNGDVSGGRMSSW